MHHTKHVDQKRFERLSVLIVDDNEHTVALITKILRTFGVRSISATADGASALRFLTRKSVDLVICDWEMRPLDGLEFTKLVRKAPESPNPFVPIIMLTGHTEIDRVVKARNAGVNDFVAKPVSPAVLLSRMVSVLDGWSDFIKAGNCLGPDGGWQDRSGGRRRPFGEVPVLEPEPASRPEPAPASRPKPASPRQPRR
ncbi:MAG: response regulator [Alphaproteobacteria bacterium]